jgi:hypothetical protein
VSIEIRRTESDTTVYRCDWMEPGTPLPERCPRETASFASKDAVVVLLDPAWLVIRAGLITDSHFCSWEHMALWVAAGSQGVKTGGVGVMADVMQQAARDRDARENAAAFDKAVQAEAAVRNPSPDILGAPDVS